MQQRPAEGKPLHHPSRERTDALAANAPEPEALEQHADALTPFRDAVEAPVEIEILDGGELAIDERFVREEADPPAIDVPAELTSGWGREAGAEPKQSGLSGAVGTGDEQEAVARKIELDAAEHAPVAETLLEPAGTNHVRTVLGSRVRAAPAKIDVSGTVPAVSERGAAGVTKA